MNTQQARALVRETFPQTFDKGRFRNFAINLLNHIDESKAQAWNSQYIKDAFKDHVKGYERLGTYTSPDQEKLDVLVVKLTTESKLERARTAIRNFVADHLKTRDGKDAALVAFISPTEKHWRFSYVKMEYTAVEKEDGKVGVHTKLTPARRSSYIVGEGESCHTAQSRFLDLLQDTENHPTLAQIEDAFSVEAVTKEFFEQYKALFLDLKDELDNLAKEDKTIGAEFAAKGVSTADFAKKLMGQIVFLYFLQKKGWLGVPKGGDWGDGPHNFLRQLFQGTFGPHENFFNDILEPLFYDTLATDRGHDAWCKTFNCRIPFLNGGLFEPLRDYDWKKTDITIPNSLFSNTKTTTAGDTGTGILDVFDRYNFTVNEAEPLEKDVAIDPEMLGKVFENLLEVKERKSKGSFYTPREIVHYMCQESLINYLDTSINSGSETIGRERRKQGLLGDERAEQTLLTAAVRKEVIPRADIETFIHSGDQASYYEAARVDGASYQRKLPKTIETNARLLDDKLADIAVCDPAIGSGAFPVGMMQEIVRARSALTPYFNDVDERTAYHFKRHAIQNCLYGVDIDPGAVEIAKLRLWLSLVVDEDDVKQIKPLPNLDYKIVVGNSLMGFPFKSQKQKEIEKLKLKFFDEPGHDAKAKLKKQIDTELSALFAAAKKSLGYEVTFDFEVYFSEVFESKSGFDIIIGNPPYGIDFSFEDKALFKRIFADVHTRTPDSFNYFISKSRRLLNRRAVLTFIVPSVLFFQNEYEKTRRMMLINTLQVAVNFGDGIFSSATVPSCVFVMLNEPNQNYAFQYCDLRGCSGDLSGWETNLTSCGSTNTLDTPGAVFGVLNEAYAILKKVTAKSFEIDDLAFEVAAGIGTGGDKVFRVARAFAKAQDFESALLHPVLVGGEIDKWLIRDTRHLIIYPNKNAGIEKFKNIYAYLQPFQQQLSQKRETRNGTLPWWCLHWPRYPELFSGRKIVMRQTSDSIRATIDDDDYFVLNSILVLKLKPDALISYEATLAILNSSLTKFIYRSLTQEEGRTFAEVKPKNVRKLLIPKLSKDDAQALEKLTNRILAAKHRDAEADTTAPQREIDELLYSLYGLTKEEKALVQSTAK